MSSLNDGSVALLLPKRGAPPVRRRMECWWNSNHTLNGAFSTVAEYNTPSTTLCPSVHYNLCTYFNSGMAGPITMIFYEVKI